MSRRTYDTPEYRQGLAAITAKFYAIRGWHAVSVVNLDSMWRTRLAELRAIGDDPRLFAALAQLDNEVRTQYEIMVAAETAVRALEAAEDAQDQIAGPADQGG